MRSMLGIVLLLIMSATAAAQQTASPSQLAIQIDSAVGMLAQRAEYDEQQIASLQKQLTDLKAKCGHPCKDEKK